jgi:hypothetical protein
MASIVILQTWWRRLLTKSEMRSLRLLDDRGSFEDFADAVNEPNVVRTTSHFLKAHGLPKTSARLFLAAFVIHHWGDEVTGVKEGGTPAGMETTPQEEISWAVRVHADRLVRFYASVMTPLTGSPRCARGTRRDATRDDTETPKPRATLLDQMLRVWRFSRTFDTWKVMDKKSILDHMCYNYTELSNCKNMIETSGDVSAPANQEVLEYINKQQSKIVKHIEQLAGTGLFDTVMETYRPVKLSCSVNQMREVMHKAFWDKIAEDLAKIPPEHKHTLVLLEEIKTLIRQFVPRRADIHEEMEGAVDIKLIDQMISKGVFDHGELARVLLYLIHLIRRLEPPVEDADTDEWLVETERGCAEYKPWQELLPSFFRRAFKKLEGIRDGLEVLQDFAESRDKP